MIKRFWKWLLQNSRWVLNQNGWAGVAAGLIGGGIAAYSASKARKQQEKQFEQQMEQYERVTEPQIEAQEWALPYQKEMMEAYAPLYKEEVALEREMLPYRREAMEAVYPRMPETIEKLYGEIMERPEALPEEQWARAWREARERSREAYRYGLTELGERAAGAGVMRGGPVQQLATQMGISQAEMETGLGMEEALRRYYEEKGLRREYIEDLFRMLGAEPTPKAVAAPAMPGISIGAMPTAPAPETLDPYMMGKMMSMMPTSWGQPSVSHFYSPATPGTYGQAQYELGGTMLG